MLVPYYWVFSVLGFSVDWMLYSLIKSLHLWCWLYSIYSKWEWFTHDNINSYSWKYSRSWRDSAGLHGKRDTLERDIFIGGLFSFSPIVIFVIWIYKSSSPTDYYSHSNTTFGFGIILGFVLDEVMHSLIRSLPLSENIWQSGVTKVIFRMIHSMIESLI